MISCLVKARLPMTSSSPVSSRAGRDAERLGRVAPQGDEPSSLAQRLRCSFEGRDARDEIDGHVHPGSAGQLPQGLHHILLRGVHNGLRPHLAAFAELFRRDVHGDDAGVGPAGHHDHVDPHPAARPEDGNRLQRGDAGPADHLVGGHDGIADDGGLGRMFLIINPVGNVDEVAGGQFDELRIAPVHLAADETGQVVAKGFPVDPAPAAMPATEVSMDGDDVPRP